MKPLYSSIVKLSFGALLALIFGLTPTDSASVSNDAIGNERVMIDMVQNNPGDAVAWQSSKYIDPFALVSLNYTGQVTTGELSGALAVDFSSTGMDIFPDGSASRAWLDAFSSSIARVASRAKEVSAKLYFFVDLLVFPVALLDAVPAMKGPGNKVAWNDVTKKYLSVMVNETFSKFGDAVDGWVVRTGETYVYDTPFHVGNSPSDSTIGRWVDFITTLREFVCVQNGKKLFMRAWDNWPSDAAYYLNMTSQIPPHDMLYFSVKHSAGDFTRPAQWNPTLGVGHHAQIVEVELQREYESKGAIPNYVMNGIIDGFSEMGANKVGLSSIVNATQIRGLWTWTRGGGWWGPYIHGREIWIDLHARVLAKWWTEKGARSEDDVFRSVVPDIFQGCAGACVDAMRSIALMSSDMVLKGQWGTVPSCGTWMRDDRMGGLSQLGCFNQLGSNDTLWAASIAEKSKGYELARDILATFEKDVAPHLENADQAETIRASAAYAKYLYAIIASSWPLLRQAYAKKEKLPLPMSLDQVNDALKLYDARWSAYRAFGLATTHAASLYHDYYLCLGTTCNGAFDPPDADMQSGSIQGKNAYGLGNSIDGLRVHK